jgi:hypothetical protein
MHDSAVRALHVVLQHDGTNAGGTMRMLMHHAKFIQ